METITFTGANTEFVIWMLNEYQPNKWNIVFNGNLDLRSHPKVTLPENLTVNGFLDVSYLGIDRLPKNLTVNGGLYAKENKLTSLPDDLYVKYCIYLDYNKIVKEIKSFIGELTIMDDEQKFLYNRVIKINKIRERTSNEK